MKKILVLLLAVTAMVSLAACGQKPDNVINPGIQTVDAFQIPGTGAAGTVEVTGERNALNPLTGLHNMAADRAGMRPIAVSVNNITESWPQYGISQADYILEIETEGGITRMMCLYADTREVDTIGSLRSLRDQFIEALYPLDPVIVHIGTSIYADRAIMQYNFPTIDTEYVTPAMWTDSARLQQYATEHTKFTGGASIETGIEAANIETKSSSTVTAFNFVEEDAEKIVPSGGDALQINYLFSENDLYYYDGDFRYDEATGTYLKWQFGKMQVDAGNDDQQLAFDNVFLLFADIDPIPNSGEHPLVKVTYSSGGTGYYFSQGRYEEITWSKDDYPGNFVFRTSAGEDLSVNVGKTHMGIVDVDMMDDLVIGGTADTSAEQPAG